MLIIGPEEYGPIPAELRDVVVPDDDVWLVISVHLESVRGSARCQGPWIQLRETLALADWFREMQGQNPRRREMYFEEPNLTFEAFGPSDRGYRVRVVLDAECRVPWSPGDVGDPGSDIVIDVSASDLGVAASDLVRAVNPYRGLN